MLVLTRRVGETIRIGDDVSICILEIQRGQVRVAIDAPRQIPVHREEVYLAVQEENKKAADTAQAVDPGKLWPGARKKGKVR
jgi:carbon storage regulator